MLLSCKSKKTKTSFEVSVVIPIKDETDPYIDLCLSSLKEMDYNKPFEVIVVKGGNRAQARNLGINLANGAIVAFIDSDCLATKNWLSSLVNKLKENPELGGVGGMNVSPLDGPFLGKLIDHVFSSYLGSLGSASLHICSDKKITNSLACINSAFWRKLLLDVGGFDEEFDLCEDTNLSYKVRVFGYTLLFDPKIVVTHYRRDSLIRFAKQFFLYGVGRMRSIFTNRSYAQVNLVLPFIGVLLFPLLFWLFPAFGLVLILSYFLLVFLKAFHVFVKTKSKKSLLLIPMLLLTEHFSFFLGMLYGITKGKWTHKKGNSEVFYTSVIEH